MNTVANFNGQRPVIDPDDAVPLLLIDHQSGLFQTVVRHGDDGIARQRHDPRQGRDPGQDPVITSASAPSGPNGPLIPPRFTGAALRMRSNVARRGQINAWDNPDFVAAVKATGRNMAIEARNGAARKGAVS